MFPSHDQNGPSDIATDEQIAAALIIAEDEDIKQGFETKLKVEIAKGELTAEEANGIMQRIEDIKNAYDQTNAYPGLDPEQKSDIARKILELEKLEEDKSNATNRRMQKGYDALIKAKQREIDDIIDQSEKEISDLKERAVAEKETQPETEKAEDDIIEARKIAAFAVSRDNNLTLEELSHDRLIINFS